ncbi:MAG: hypothetical protein A07HN63_01165 [uncultured archaeon A07HN63]|nr:MAG: hypothetical protein A07HN63_01165 [uncultured archaeon A07HN63]
MTTESAVRELSAEQRDDLATLNEVLRHDIRNDLQLITSYADMLSDHVDVTGEAYLATIQESADTGIGLYLVRTLLEGYNGAV